MIEGNLSTFSSDILAVDDVPENLKVLMSLLIPAGYKVRPASSGAEALDAVVMKKPDLILLDIKMPGMDGFEVCKRLKADSQSKGIPIIFISALDETVDKGKAFHAGGVDYITKPFEEKEVLMRVQTHLELQRMRMNLEGIVADRTLALRMSEERFRMTFEQAAVGVAHVSSEGRFLRINQKLCDIVGYNKEEMQALTFQEITHPDDLDTDLEYVQQVLDGKIESYSMEKRYFKKDGDVVWINLTVSLLREEKGEPRYFIAVVEDISVRKEAEDMLEISQAITHVGNWSIKSGEEIVVCSKEVCRIFGLPVGSTCTFEMFNEIIHPDDREYVKNSWMTALNHNQFDCTYRILVDGQLKWVEVKAESMFHEEDATISAIGTVQDITNRKHAEQTIEEQLAFEQLVSELSGQFVNLPAEEIDSAIIRGLGRVAEFIGADRASIVQPEGDDYKFSHYWLRQGISPAPPQAASMGSYPWLARQVLGGRAVVFSQLDDLSPNAEEDREMFTKLGIQSLLSLPLVANKVPVGAVSFTTVERQYHWSEPVVERMKLVAVILSHALERKRSQMALEERLQFQNLVSKIAKNFIGLSSVELEQARQAALAEIGRYFEVDAVRLYRLSPQGDIIEMRNVWVSEHSVAVEETTEMETMKYPHLAAHYLQGETIVYGCPDECPQLPDLIKILKYAKITAGVGVPLEIDDSGVDVFALAKTQSEHVWPKDIVKYCKILGQILLSAMRRTDAEVSLQDRYDEIKQLKKRVEQENIHLRKEIKVLYSHDEIIGKSQPIKTVLSQAEQVAEQETSVLVLGETGTGKELLARAIHDMSPRKKRAMITVNCAALPVTLIEGELFGREKGAYTGALTKQSGRFELADKSTVFLDEIGDLPLEMQVKLLRVLQEGQFERLGSAKTITVDVRVIAATNLDLEQAVREGRFRKDLFYRLSVFPITVPPLRDRTEDIPMLVWTFVKDFGKRMGKTVEHISDKTMDRLMSYTWPGNVRELRNLIERAMILHSGEILHIEKIQAEDQEIDQPTSLEEVERNHIRSVLAKKNWKVSGKNGAAEALGLKESTLRARMGKLGIKRGE